MGKFDGYLICSDVDFTLGLGTEICRENLEAIRYFQENGGLFTLSTGRNCRYVKEHFYDRLVCNTYLITLNGTVVLDPETEKTVLEHWLPEETCQKLLAGTEQFRDRLVRRTLCSGTRLENFEGQDLFPANKLVFVTHTEEDMAVLRPAVEALCDGSYTLNQSWITGLEAIPAGSGKGTCVAFVKKLLGDRARVTIAVGDNENDLSMLLAADVSYAVEDAQAFVRAAADRLTRKCMEGSIAKIVEDIEAGLI